MVNNPVFPEITYSFAYLAYILKTCKAFFRLVWNWSLMFKVFVIKRHRKRKRETVVSADRMLTARQRFWFIKAVLSLWIMKKSETFRENNIFSRAVPKQLCCLNGKGQDWRKCHVWQHVFYSSDWVVWRWYHKDEFQEMIRHCTVLFKTLRLHCFMVKLSWHVHDLERFLLVNILSFPWSRVTLNMQQVLVY